MPLGPIVEFELKTSTRKRRFYMLRSAYGVFLLYLIWVNYSLFLDRKIDDTFTPREIATINLAIFGMIAVFQYLFVLVLTPALVAGAIADEKRRKTLHYLLTSRLTGGEIVFGKIVVRMFHLAVLVAVGLPILSMLVIMGGVDPRLVGLSFAAAGSTALLLAGFTIWMSTLAWRIRDALFASYAVELLWLVFIPYASVIQSQILISPAVNRVLGIVIEWLIASHPMSLIDFNALMSPRSNLMLKDSTMMVAVQSILGALFIAIAAFRLRAVFRAQDGRIAGKRARLIKTPLGFIRSRFERRPECGEDPMLWKECWTVRKVGLARRIGRFASFLLILMLFCSTFYYAYYALMETLLQGWIGGGDQGFGERFTYTPGAGMFASRVPIGSGWRVPDRGDFFSFLHLWIPFVSFVYLTSIGANAATGIAGERDSDTWTSLTTTTLTGGEITRAKIRGAIRSNRVLVYMIYFMLICGIAANALSWPSIVLAAVQLTVYARFVAIVGTGVSLISKTTYRAQLFTFGGLVFFNFLGQGLMNVWDWLSPRVYPGFMPYQISVTLYEPWSVQFLRKNPISVFRDYGFNKYVICHDAWGLLLIALAGLSFYIIAGSYFSRRIVDGFDRVVGRPARPNAVFDALNVEIEPG